MAELFDPYRKWLGIPPAEQPPNHYRLLGVGLFEDDADTIANAADRQMAHIRTFQTGPHSAVSQKLLNELAAARLALLDEKKKAAYDRQLRDKQSESSATADGAGQGRGVAVPVSSPLPLAVANAVPRAVPHATPPIAAAPAGQGRGVATSDPIVISPSAVVTPSRRSGTKRSRRESVLWIGVASAAAVLAAVVYIAREQLKEDGQSISVAVKKAVPPAQAKARSVVENGPGDVPPRSDVDVDDASNSADGLRNASSDEILERSPAAKPSGDNMPSAKEDSPNRSDKEQKPAEKRTSLAELLNRAEQPRIDGRRRDAAPEGKTLAAANARFSQLYGKEITKAKTPDAVRKLSLRFYNLAREGVDTADVRYVLLGMSGTSAANQGNVGLAYRVAAELARQFEVDSYALKLKALEVAGKNATSPTANAVGVLQALSLAERAAAIGKGDVASKAAAQASLLARKTKDKDLMARADQAKAALREQSSRNAAYQKSLAELKKTPGSPHANLAAGKYDLLVLGDWAAGLKRLAASGEPRLMSLAESEALARVDLSQWAPLAGAWWQIAETEEDGFFKLQCQLQAKYCYLRAKTLGRAGETLAEMADQLRTLPGYPLSRLRPGAAARYYEGDRFGRQCMDRIDPAIDFWFGGGSPDPTVPNDHFSARWTGFFKAPVGGRYLIVTHTDDAVRLWVDGKQLLDRWVMAAGWQQVELELTADLHTIQMEYNELFGPAFAMLGWTLAAFPDPDHVQWSPIDVLYYDPESPFELPEQP